MISYREARHRLQNDFRVGVLMLFGVCAVLCIFPFAIYRFIRADMLIGALDTLIVLTIAGCGLYALQTGDTRRPGLVLIVGTNIAAVLMAAIHPFGLYWVYAALVANFFLVGLRTASIVTTLSLAALVLHGAAFNSALQLSSFLVTAVLVSLFSFIFAHRTEMQHRQLVALASEDPLTGLQNRRAMEQELQIAVQTQARQRTPYSLMVIDLDHFKRVNDERGHEAGDNTLRAFADLIRRTTRQCDRVFRFGGEEFVVLLQGADHSNLQDIAENLRRRTATLFEGQTPSLTISLGCGVLNEGEDWREWLSRADAALYRAKERGRDRVEIDPGRAPIQIARA